MPFSWQTGQIVAVLLFWGYVKVGRQRSHFLLISSCLLLPAYSHQRVKHISCIVEINYFNKWRFYIEICECIDWYIAGGQQIQNTNVSLKWKGHIYEMKHEPIVERNYIKELQYLLQLTGWNNRTPDTCKTVVQ